MLGKFDPDSRQLCKPSILSSGIDDKILSGKPQAKFYHLCQPQVYILHTGMS